MIDINRDTTFFNKIGKHVISELSENNIDDFNLVSIVFSVQPDACEMEGHYIRNDQRNELDIDFPYEMYTDLQNFHFEMTRDGKNKWNELIFSIDKNKEFSAEYNWNQEEQDEIDQYNKEEELEDPTYQRPKWPWEN